MKNLTLSCLAVSLLALTACSAKSTAPNFDSAAMDGLLSQAVGSGEVIGVSALVFDEGQTVYTGAFGLADRERETPLTQDTVFRIYSMTKPVTAVLIMDLVEDGKIDLNAPAANYIPELANMQVASTAEDGSPVFTPQAQPMTVKDLMLHRAGMGYGIFGPISPVEDAYMKAGLFEPSEDLSVKMQKLSKLPLLIQPGEGWYYSYSIDVLGRIAEVVTEQRLGDLMQARIFGPLGMSETSFGVTPDQKPRFASNYQIQEDGSFVLAEDGQTSPYLNENAFQSGGGGLVSTLGDYAKFAQMLLEGGGDILAPETVAMMMTDQMDPDDKFLMDWIGAEKGVGFGYGGSVVNSATDAAQAELGQYEGQWGWGGAARTNFYIDPANNAFGVIMLQFFSAEDPDLHAAFQALALAQTRDDVAD